MSFVQKVITVVKEIPRGQTLSYKKVAQRAGNPKAFRAVGNILNRCGGMKKGVPCHRVIKSNGQAGGYVHGTAKKIKLLKSEGAIKECRQKNSA